MKKIRAGAGAWVGVAVGGTAVGVGGTGVGVARGVVVDCGATGVGVGAQPTSSALKPARINTRKIDLFIEASFASILYAYPCVRPHAVKECIGFG